MVKNGQASTIRTLSYQTAPDSLAGLEVLTFSQLHTMPAGGTGHQIQRADFHVLALVESGQGQVTVDFVQHRLEAGLVVWIRPGRVHRWDDVTAISGMLTLFRPEFVPRDSPAATALGPVAWRQPTGAALVRLAADHLRREYAAALTEPLAATADILRDLLNVLLIRVGNSAPPPVAGRTVFTVFTEAVEAHHAHSRELAWYAHLLGYSPKTLTRATQEAAGVGAKKFIDDRVLLEAKRLLAHSDVTATECARQVGFDDDANFSKFFRARTGLSPGTFRTTIHGGA